MAASERGRFHAAGLELTMPNAGKMFAEQAGSSSVKLRSSATMQYDVAAASSHQFLVNGATVAQIGPGAFGTNPMIAAAQGQNARTMKDRKSTRLNSSH